MARSLEDIEDDLDEYADFEEVASVSRAKSYVTAARRWLMRVAGSSSHGGSMTRNVVQVEGVMKRATEFIEVNDTTAGSQVRFLGVGTEFRT